jgi:phosphatidyl-N-methylethanolamine N-methyltransferase
MLRALLAGAVLLSLERASYVWIARNPRRFRAWCGWPAVTRLGEPIAVVRKLFYGFKLVQLSVFAGWCYVFENGASALHDRDPVAFSAGLLLIAVGQALNWSVFYRLGVVGVFFGDRFGYVVPRCRQFPFSVFAHPQYVGTVLSIWGLFVALRFPHDDWVVIPALETVYYVIGARLEDGPAESTATPTDALEGGRPGHRQARTAGHRGVV